MRASYTSDSSWPGAMHLRNRLEMVFYLLGLFLVRYPRSAILFVAVIVIGCRLVPVPVCCAHTFSGFQVTRLSPQTLKARPLHACFQTAVRGPLKLTVHACYTVIEAMSVAL